MWPGSGGVAVAVASVGVVAAATRWSGILMRRARAPPPFGCTQQDDALAAERAKLIPGM